MRSLLLTLSISVAILVLPRHDVRAGGFNVGRYVQNGVNSVNSGLNQFDRGRVAVMTNPVTYQAVGTAVGGYYGGPAGAAAGNQIGGSFGAGVAGRPAGGGYQQAPPPTYGGAPVQQGYPNQAYDPRYITAQQQLAARQHQYDMEAYRYQADLQRQADQRQAQIQQQQMQWQFQQQRQLAQQQEQQAVLQGIFNTVGGVVQAAQPQQYSYGP